MALTHTPQATIGSQCPDFSLPATDGKTYSRGSFQDAKVLVVMFICNHCPYVKAIETRLIELSRSMQEKGVAFVGISSNDAEKYPEDSFAKMRELAQSRNYPFAYLYDESQAVAREFGAVCTPDFFVYDQDRKLAYRGRLDDSWKDPAAVQNQELRAAILGVLDGQAIPLESQKPSMGCNIKWKQT